MPACKRTPGLVALLLLVAVGSVQAETPLSRAGAAELVNDFWSLVADVSSRVGLQDRSAARPRPQAIPQGGRTIDLSDLSQPTIIEDRLRTALQPGDLRVTIPGGTARRGDYSVGSAESLTGHLLVVDGNADVYGTLRGNLVTVKGDVVVHPGGVVTGDILSLGGEVRDRGGEIGG
ncbi:MAG TPA: polymer-forming cytoskeletal protein, partial [Gemmatimonadales bacterium]|nr:polymer-forming cytoskeletal protein [Gemmatimonadales bacterium]